MTFEIIYYIFSISSFLIMALHIWNLVSLKLKHKNILGKTFRKGTLEFDTMEKSIGKSYVSAASTLSAIAIANLAFSVRNVLEKSSGRTGIMILILYGSVVLVTTIGIIVALKSTYGENPGKARRRDSDDDEDW